MSNHFSTVSIENFKSIKALEFRSRRINLFIGEPNVGKSNILEALGLFSAPYSFASNAPDENAQFKFAWDQIRYKSIAQLFHFQDTKDPIFVRTDKGVAYLANVLPQFEQFEFIIAATQSELFEYLSSNLDQPLRKDTYNFYKSSRRGFMPNYDMAISKDGKYSHAGYDLKMLNYSGFVKKYTFNDTLFRLEKGHNKFPYSLLPSFGSNIFTIIHLNPSLEDLVASLFEKYDLELVFNEVASEYLIQRKKGRIANQLPYTSIADTLQRIIFHLAAIRSNKESVLIFEEPEAHTFPTYITQIAEEIINSQTNQFFIASHSPYLVERIIEKASADDVAVFVCQYKDHQTTVRELSSEELSDMKKYKFDLIYNVSEFSK